MAILVTGGAGYIGSVVVEDLRSKNVEVVVLDNLSRGHREAVAPEVKFYQGDIGDKALVTNILRENEIEAVMHFSAFAYVGESVEKPNIYYENNTEQTKLLLDTLIENDVKKFVFSSTCATYGEPQYMPLDEKHPQSPSSPYGWSKLFVEQILKDYERAFGLKFVALRYFNACGATETHGEHHEPETHLIPLVLEVAAGKRDSIAIFGDDYPTDDGTAVRDYIHVLDLSQAHLLAVQHLQKDGESQFINLGNGLGFSVLEVVEATKKVTGKEIPVKITSRRAGDPSKLIADAKKAREVLGWNPQFAALETIIESAWKWHQKHSKGYDTEK
ncbi:MAG: UDP-glucose 4-epimerase GalE [Pyrinomonadaceae bacterium]|nr:UDP-glucose 4-epimerase GalE [Pyrinomonadaceae bacterium]